MQGTTIILIGVVATLVIIVLMALVVRIYKEGDGLGGLLKVLPVFFVALMAVIVLAQITEEVKPYSYDDESGTLRITMNIEEGYSPWDDYADDVRSLIIQDGVRIIGPGAFDTLTQLTYISICKGVTIGPDAFDVTVLDCMGEPVEEDIGPGQYIGREAGTLYVCDPSIYTYSADGSTLNGLVPDYASASVIVLPTRSTTGSAVEIVNTDAFRSDTSITEVYSLPDSKIRIIRSSAFRACTNITYLTLPDSLTTLGESAFNTCRGLTSVELPSKLTTLGNDVFHVCTALTSVTIPDSLTSVGVGMFSGCTALASVELPSTLKNIRSSAFSGCTRLQSVDMPASVVTVGNLAFQGCTGITDVSFDSSFSEATVTSNSFGSWTFYESDGTTVIDKTVAANLAGKTFEGTAAALVEVYEGERSLTPDQIQKVRLHDAELQDLDQITLDPLPFQPSLQEELTA